MTVFNIDGINYSRFRDVPGAVYTRSGVEYQQNAAGVWTPFDDDVPPISAGVGVDVWQGATNLLQNSGLAGGSQPTNWTLGVETGTGSVQASTIIPANFSRTCNVVAGQRQFQTQVISLAANTTYTVSIDVEAVSGAPGEYFAYAASLPAGATATLLDFPTSTGRKTFTITVGATAGTAQIRIGLGTGNIVAGAGSVTWSNPQVEAGTVATSRITTPVGGTATRGNPTMYINAPGLLVPPYTVVAWANLSAIDGVGRVLVVASDGTNTNRVQLERTSGNGATMQVNGGTGGSGPTVPGKGGARLLKMAGRVRATEYALSVDGAAPLISSGVTPPSGLSQIRFGANPGGVGILNGAIQRFQIINRDISDTELVNLTV